MEKLQEALVIVFVAFILTVVLAWPVQLLWNSALAPALDGVNQITFWQALGINILASILFKGSSVQKNS